VALMLYAEQQEERAVWPQRLVQIVRNEMKWNASLCSRVLYWANQLSGTAVKYVTYAAQLISTVALSKQLGSSVQLSAFDLFLP